MPLDEAGACYKPAGDVVSAVVHAGLARVDKTLWPLGSLKGTDERTREKKRERLAIEKSRDRDRSEARRRKGR